jgi:hypothetical protein
MRRRVRTGKYFELYILSINGNSNKTTFDRKILPVTPYGTPHTHTRHEEQCIPVKCYGAFRSKAIVSKSPTDISQSLPVFDLVQLVTTFEEFGRTILHCCIHLCSILAQTVVNRSLVIIPQNSRNGDSHNRTLQIRIHVTGFSMQCGQTVGSD